MSSTHMDRLLKRSAKLAHDDGQGTESWRYDVEAACQLMKADAATITMLREALAESKRETIEARAAAADVEPWLWSDDDTAKTVESMSNLMTVRITGGHLRALLRDASKPQVTAKGYMSSTLTAEDLVERAVRNAGRGGDHPRMRWGWVGRIFAIGSTSASDLCRLFDLDPDTVLGVSPDDEDDL